VAEARIDRHSVVVEQDLPDVYTFIAQRDPAAAERVETMPQISFTVTQRASGKKAVVKADFSEEELGRLNAFCEYVRDVLSIKLVQAGIQCSIDLDYREGVGTTISTDLPPEEEIMALLHRLRPLILNDELASFNAVCGIIGRQIDEPLVREALKYQRRVYDGRRMQEQLVVTSTNDELQRIINSEQVLFGWLNAFEYHRDERKRAEIEKLHQLIPLDHSKAIFLMLISDKIRAITAVADLAELIIGKRETTVVGSSI